MSDDSYGTSEFARRMARGRVNDWTAAQERLEPEAWPAVRASFEVPQGGTIFTIGSCFAREIEENLRRLGYRVPTLDYRAPACEAVAGRPTRPFNKYTPADIHQELDWTAKIYERDRRPRQEDSSTFAYRLSDDRIRDLALAGKPAVTEERFFERRRRLYEIWEQVFRADGVVLTLGLIEAWSGPHGVALVDPPFFALGSSDEELFEFRVLEFEACRELLERSLSLIRRLNPGVRFLITTSPVPMSQSFSDEDILVANTYSKAVLRAVCGALVEDYEDVEYFPSYESVTLTQDTEVWDDQRHQVSRVFAAKIVARLAETCLAGCGEARRLTQRAFAALAGGRADAALDYAAGACRLDDSITDAWLARTEASKRLGLGEEALSCARRAEALAPESTEAVRHLVLALLVTGGDERLGELADRLVSLDPEDSQNALVRARARERLGDLEEAEASYRQALALQPQNPIYSMALEKFLAGRSSAVQAFPNLR